MFSRNLTISRTCLNCGEITKERKPYCEEHTEQNPYASQVISRLTEIENQNQAALNGQPEMVHMTAQDLIIFIKDYGGSMPLKALLSTFDPNSNLTQIYLDLLIQEEMVEIVQKKKTRGSATYPVVALLG